VRFVSAAEVYGPGYEDMARRVPALGKMERLLGVVARATLAAGERAARPAAGGEARR
jgi:hypothetical protein